MGKCRPTCLFLYEKAFQAKIKEEHFSALPNLTFIVLEEYLNDMRYEYFNLYVLFLY